MDPGRDGWTVLPFDPATARWARAAHRVALGVTADPQMRARWLRHAKTWFVGVDALANAADGSIDGVPLQGPWQDLIDTAVRLHPAQLSVVYPGYPGRDPDESEASFAYRRDRDAAHLDGLLAEGADKRRHLREPHAWILGLPLNASDASPLVVWSGSPAIIRAALARRFEGIAPRSWPDEDITDAYQAARREVFETCERVEVRAGPGQAVIVHRLAIHGVAPWSAAASAPPEGRMIAYFRPVLSNLADWLAAP